MTDQTAAVRRPVHAEYWTLLGAWLVLVGFMAWWPTRDLSAPGLYYDEANWAGQARDFVDGVARGPHMPGTLAVPLLGRPFPVFLQPYCGSVKAWLTMPALAIFGATPAVVRMSSLAWSAVALWLFMLWARRLLGLGGALLTGALLAVDPSYLWMTVYDWGPSVPGLLARAAGFLLALRWWRDRRWTTALLTGVCLGIGVLHKVDFAVVLAGVGIALLLAHGRSVLARLAATRRDALLALAGFVVGAGPMLVTGAIMARQKLSGAGEAASELAEKRHTLVALYDGSYFARLLAVGGDFDRMFALPAPARGVFGWAVIAALAVALRFVLDRRRADRRLWIFLVAALVLQTAGVILLPEARRIHHALLVYPFPHLLVAGVVVAICATAPRGRAIATAGVAVVLAGVLASQVVVLGTTERMLLASGGPGWWSNALESFADEVRSRADLSIISLDWGFQEPLLFLTNGPALREPFWPRAAGSLPAELARCADPDRVYLVHPPALTLKPFAAPFLRACQARHPSRLWVRPYRDRRGTVVFYAIRLAPAGAV